MLIWARFQDKKDDQKLGSNLLIDNKPENDYCYEIITFTGNRFESACDSIVRFYISGNSGDSGTRVLNDPEKNKTLRRGAVDSFIMSVEK